MSYNIFYVKIFNVFILFKKYFKFFLLALIMLSDVGCHSMSTFDDELNFLFWYRKNCSEFMILFCDFCQSTAVSGGLRNDTTCFLIKLHAKKHESPTATTLMKTSNKPLFTIIRINIHFIFPHACLRAFFSHYRRRSLKRRFYNSWKVYSFKFFF